MLLMLDLQSQQLDLHFGYEIMDQRKMWWLTGWRWEVRMKWEKIGLKPKEFYDAFPWIDGTTEEKMVYNALAIRRIPFYFQYVLPDISFTPQEEAWRVDFYLPDYKMIIEVFGSFWHMMATAMEKDAWKIAVQEAAGYEVLIWWDFEIHRDLNGLISKVAAFNPPQFRGDPYPTEYSWPSYKERASRFARRRKRIVPLRLKERKVVKQKSELERWLEKKSFGMFKEFKELGRDGRA